MAGPLGRAWFPIIDGSFRKFDGGDFSKRLKGKKVVFVGDSLSLNNFQSLLCLLHVAVPSSNTTRNTDNYFTTVIFQEF
ncbi:hypothetical protein NC653_000399 [Populus alba x Populus x berolinensis]|uniref:Trichome birefringence-like C-terminal domain-containing protein n=1 Tax=Populus alba x Populus x berolinensis TaxID=444605 RepID=A0AAD6WED9_9ROSI|nr:hypothetical protein NC653_000399 [Populus alba x Populus x berolinensis]